MDKESPFIYPEYNFEGKVAVVTGGSTGLGFSIARTLARFGAAVMIASYVPEECQIAEQKLQSLKFNAKSQVIDVTREDQVNQMIDKTIDAFGHLDILVSNAGIGGKTKPLIEQSVTDWDRVVATNLKGVFLCGQSAAKQMRHQENGGKIVNIASVAALLGTKHVAPYGASKAGVVNLTKTMANEWAKYNINVNAVCPGYVLTDINKDVFSDPETKDRLEKKIPLRRIGKDYEIAGTVAFLCSQSANYITGSTITVDGGTTIGG